MPTAIDLIPAAFCLAALVTPYLLYPLVVRYAIRPRARGEAGEPGASPSVSVLIPAHNEAARLEDKLLNTLSLAYPSERVEILVASDGSADATASIARAYENQGVRVFELTERGGKLAALKHLLAHARGDLILFTDVGASLQTDILRELARDFDDPQVMVTMPRYASTTGGTGAAAAEGAYWSRETRLKELEAERDMLLGAHGACYLMRREAVANIPDDTIHDDFLWPLLARADGGRIAYRSDLVVSDDPPTRLRTIFERTARMAQGNLQILWRYRKLLGPSDPRMALSLIGHKLFKTLGPLWILGLVLWINLRARSVPALVPLAVAGDLLLLLLLAATAWKATGRALPKVLAVGVHALVAQAACAMGILRFAFRVDATRWRRPAENDVLTLDLPAPPPRSVRFTKRLLDIVGSLVALVLALPLLPIIVLLIWLDSPGPIFYRQERVATDYAGRPRAFAVWKFRTMRVDAEADGQAVWATENDPRVTSVGAVLRKLRLDEIPQLVQVLRGDMSLVGPRPERPSISGLLAAQLPGYDDRHPPCKPGITGWAQVHTGYDTSVESVRQKITYDFAYNAHLYDLRSYLVMELRVLLLTIAVIVRRKGAR